jgi:hypothetical protein
MKQFNLNFKIKMSKKQMCELSQLDTKYHFRYIMSFIQYNGFNECYTNLSRSIPSPKPFERIRINEMFIRDSLNSGIHWKFERLKRERQRLLMRIPTTKLKKLIKTI